MTGEQSEARTQPDVTPRDVLGVAQRALAKANDLDRQVDDLEDTVEQLHERVLALEAASPDGREYELLDRPTKVGMVREHLVEKARAQHGRAAIDYDDVMWGVFDGEPSADHCYTLMERAAQADGFDLRDPASGNREAVVNIDATKPTLGFSRANKDAAEGGR